MNSRSFVLAATAVSIATGSASAVSLGLFKTDPDVASGFIGVDYDAVSHVFSAVGFTQNLELPPASSLGNRLFSLTALIDNNGNLLSGGAALTVRGDFGGSDQLLFSSTSIIDFGFSAFNKFEFRFTQQAGSLASVGATIGTILVDTGLSFPGGTPDFHASFSGRIFPGGPGAANADTFAPAPSPALSGCVLAGLVARRRRR